MNFLRSVALLLLAATARAQYTTNYYMIQISTPNARAAQSISGYVKVAASSVTASTPTIILDGVKGGVNASSFTATYGVKASTFTGDGSALTNLNGASIQVGTVDTSRLATDSVSTVKIINGAVDTTKLASDSVSNAKILNGAVDTAKLATDAVSNSKILNGAVDTNKLATDSVSNAKIINGAVDTNKLATDAVSNTKILNGSVDTNKIANDAITNVKILNGTISAAKLNFAAGTGNVVNSAATDWTGAAWTNVNRGSCTVIPSNTFTNTDYTVIAAAAPGSTITYTNTSSTLTVTLAGACSASGVTNCTTGILVDGAFVLGEVNTGLGLGAGTVASATYQVNVGFERRLTLAAGSHSYTVIRAVNSGGTGTFPGANTTGEFCVKEDH